MARCLVTKVDNQPSSYRI